MNKEMEKLIQQMLYNMTKEEVLDTLSNIESPEVLYVYAYNYNWDNGFEIPEKIINKKCCDLSTALMMFYKSDGFRYLQEKDNKIGGFENWIKLVDKLYLRIINNTYQKSDIKFEPPLSKVQIYKLSKLLKRPEYIFIEPIGLENLNKIL